METIGLPIRVFAIDTLCSGTRGGVGHWALFQAGDAGSAGDDCGDKRGGGVQAGDYAESGGIW